MDDKGRSESMSRQQFRELLRDQRLRDRQGREWTVTGGPRETDGLAHVMARSGDLVRRIDERFRDEYTLIEDDRLNIAG